MSEISNVDLDLSGISGTRPMFDNVWITCRTGNVEVKKADNSDRKDVVIPLIFEEEVTATDGRKVPVGYQHSDRIGLTPSGGRTAAIIKENLTRFQCAALKINVGKLFDAAEVSGKLVRAKFEVDGEYQRVKAYIAVK